MIFNENVLNTLVKNFLRNRMSFYKFKLNDN